MSDTMKYRTRMLGWLLFLSIAPFMVYYSWSFGDFLALNALNSISGDKTIELTIDPPTHYLWFETSKGLAALVILLWFAGEFWRERQEDGN